MSTQQLASEKESCTIGISGVPYIKWRNIYLRPSARLIFIKLVHEIFTSRYQKIVNVINLLATDFFLQILAHPVFKM
jgi:hypothetical protein